MQQSQATKPVLLQEFVETLRLVGQSKRSLALQVDLLVRHQVTKVVVSSPDSSVDTFTLTYSRHANAHAGLTRWTVHNAAVEVTITVFRVGEDTMHNYEIVIAHGTKTKKNHVASLSA